MLITFGTKRVKGSLDTGKLPRAFKNSAKAKKLFTKLPG